MELHVANLDNLRHVQEYYTYSWGRRGRDRMVVEFQLPMQSVPITTDVVRSNLEQGAVYNIIR